MKVGMVDVDVHVLSHLKKNWLGLQIIKQVDILISKNQVMQYVLYLKHHTVY